MEPFLRLQVSRVKFPPFELELGSPLQKVAKRGTKSNLRRYIRLILTEIVSLNGAIDPGHSEFVWIELFI